MVNDRPTSSLFRKRGRTAAAIAGLAMVAASLSPAVADAAPPRAQGPDTAALAGDLADQKLEWHDCSFPDLSPETAAKIKKLGTKCATVTVPRDWHNPDDGNTITVEMSRTKASDPAKRHGIMMLNPGGPGGSGLAWGGAMPIMSPEVGAAYDTIGFDPRGVGQSSELICEYDANASTQAEAAQKYAEGCLDNPLTPYITTWQTTMDMDFMRHLLGEEKLNYIGYSYGTWLGGSYAATFGDRTDRFVLDSSVDMSTVTLERTWDLQPPSRDRQFQDMMLPWIARHNDEYKMGETALEAREKFEASGGFDNQINLMLGASTTIQAMYSTNGYPKAAAVLSSLSARDTSTDREDFRQPFTAEAAEHMDAAVAEVKANLKALPIDEDIRAEALEAIDTAAADYHGKVKTATAEGPAIETDKGAFEAIRCQDGQWTQDLDVWEDKLTKSFQTAPLTSMMQSIPVCAFWPAQEKGFPDQVKDNKLPHVLFVQSEFDAATPFEGAEGSFGKFRKSPRVVVDNEGSHGLFPYGVDCVDDPVLDWVLEGRLPKGKGVGCVGAPLPTEDVTYNVGGSVNKHGKVKDFDMTSEDLVVVNEMVAKLREEAGITVVPGGQTDRMTLPIR